MSGFAAIRAIRLVTTGCVAGTGADVIELPPGHGFTYADPITDASTTLLPTCPDRSSTQHIPQLRISPTPVM